MSLIKAGDKVGASEATLLAKLGIKPFSYGLIVKHVSALQISLPAVRVLMLIQHHCLPREGTVQHHAGFLCNICSAFAWINSMHCSVMLACSAVYAIPCVVLLAQMQQ